MATAQIIQGSGEELLEHVQRHRSHRNLMLIIPSEDPSEGRSLTDEEIVAANVRLRGCIMEGAAGSLRNEDIDADLARAYGNEHSEEAE